MSDLTNKWFLNFCPLHPPVSQRAVLAGASVEAGVGRVGGAGQVDLLSGPAATPRRGRGRQRHQRGVSGAESHRGLAERHVAAAASRLAAVGVRTVVDAHLGDGHAQNGLQLRPTESTQIVNWKS